MNFQLVYYRRSRLGLTRQRKSCLGNRAMKSSVLFTFLLLATNALGVQLFLNSFVQKTEQKPWNAAPKNGMAFEPKSLKNVARENSVSEDWKNTDNESSASDSSSYSDEEGNPYEVTDKILPYPDGQTLSDDIMPTDKAVSIHQLDDTSAKLTKLYIVIQYMLATIGVTIGFILVCIFISHIFRWMRIYYNGNRRTNRRTPARRVNRLNTLPPSADLMYYPQLVIPNNEDSPVYYIKNETGVGGELA